MPEALPCDYDSDPDRFAASLAIRRHLGGNDVFGVVAQDLLGHGSAGPVLEVGGGPGPLARHLHGTGIAVVVADIAAYYDADHPPTVRTDALALGFGSGCFGTVAALWMLYHLADPVAALAEASRVMRPDGWFVSCAPSRFNDPELAAVLPGWGLPLTFDAENAADQVASIFELASIRTWDRPILHLPTSGHVQVYLRGRGLSPGDAEDAASRTPVPLRITKRGALIWARKRYDR